MKSAQSQVYKTASEAWQFLVAQGGLEPGERDGVLVDQIVSRLAPAESEIGIEAALQDVSVERFLNIFFDAVGRPFVGMMRGLLAYFERAGVTEGPNQLVLSLGEGNDQLEIDLDHFRRWLSEWDDRETGHEIVQLDYGQMFSAQRQFDTLPGREALWKYDDSGYRHFSAEVRLWLAEYDSDAYPTLPGLVTTLARREDAIGEYATLTNEVFHVMSSMATNRKAFYTDNWFGRNAKELPPDIALYARAEHDRWLRYAVVNLALFLESDGHARSAVVRSLAHLFAGKARRQARFPVRIEDLLAVLSLPVWKRRYELYSAWVFTLVLRALDGHNIELYHEDGKLKFAFRETRMAAVHLGRARIDIFAEKYVEATGLRGHGREHGVQPDYSAWIAGGNCAFAIECKHYKRPSTRNFEDSLHDYALALPYASVLLVNYGPLTQLLISMTEAADPKARRLAWGNVTPEFPDQIAKFTTVIRRVVGEPIRHMVGAAGGGILVIDVSGSVAAILKRVDAVALVSDIACEAAVARTAAVNDSLRGEFGATVAEIEAALEYAGGTTALVEPVRQLRELHPEVFVLTDDDGLATLGARALEIRRIKVTDADWLLVARFD